MKNTTKRITPSRRLLTILMVVIFIVGIIPSFGFAQSEGEISIVEEETMAPESPVESPPAVEPETPLPEDVSEQEATFAGDETPVFTVRFLDYNDAPIGDPQQVLAGTAATPPSSVPAPKGQQFSGWNSNDYLNVQTDLNIHALYKKSPEAKTQEIEALTSKTYIKARDLTVSDTSKEYGSPDPRPVLLGMPSNLVDGVDYHVEYTRTPAESVSSIGYHVTVSNFYFINSRYALSGDEDSIKEGTLCITNRKITITANSSSRVYNGLPLTNSTYTVGGSGLPSGHTANVAISGTQTVVGSSANTVGTVTIKNASNVDVTSFFTITKVNGTLTVTRAPLTIRADNKTIAYGDPAPTYTVTYTGFVNGEGSAALSTPPTLSSSYTVGSAPGTYPIICADAVAANYAITYQPGTLTVNSNGSQITVTANSASKVYDGTPLTNNTFTSTGVPAGHHLVVTISGSVTTVAQSSSGNNIITNVKVIRNSDSADVTAYFPNVIKAAGTLTVTRAPLTAEMADLSINFGDAAPTYTVSYTGFKNGETQSVLLTQTTPACPYVQGNFPGNYPITGSGATAANYTVNYLPGVLAVHGNNTLVTVTAANDNKVYDGAPLTNNNYTVSGLPAGYTLTATVTGSATNVADSTSGNNVVSNVLIRRTSDSADVTAHFSNVVLANGTLSITPAPLTVEMDDLTISFNAPIPPYPVIYTGFKNGETESTLGVFTTPISINCPYAQGDAPGNYNITGSAIVAPNYNINYLPGVLTVQKSANQITVIANSNSKVYDGTALTDSGITYSGLPAGYTATADVTNTSPIINVAQSTPGNNVISNIKILNGSSVDVTTSFENIVGVNGTLTITPAPLTAEMTDYVVEYNDPAPAYTVTYTGFKNGETSAVLTNPTVASCSYAPGSTVGGYAITGSGATADNYTISYLAGTLTVVQDNTQVTIMARYDSKTYDGTPLTNSGIIFSGLPAGHTVTATVNGSATTVADSIPNNNNITAYTIWDNTMTDVTGDYSNIVLVPGTLTITPAPLTIKMEDKSIQYADVAPAYTQSYSGFVNGETSAVLISTGTASCPYVPGNAPGNYTITGSGASAANYTISYQPGTLAVHNNNTEITLVAGYDTKVYDGTSLTKNTYSQVGGSLPAGYSFDVTVAPLSPVVNVADSAPGNNKISVKVRNSSNVDVTSYFSNIATVDGTLTISPAPLIVHITNQSVQFASPPPTYTVTYSGFVNGENSSVLLTPPLATCSYAAGDPAGSYPITGSGATAANYTISYTDGTLTVSSVRTPITVIGAYATKVYDGDPLVAPTFTVSGTLPTGYSVEATVTGSATNVADSITGNNVVSNVVIKNASNVDVTSSFESISTVNGTLTITPAPLTIDVLDEVDEYGDPIPTYHINYIGFVHGETAAVLTTLPTITCPYTQGSNAGFYPITGSGAAAANYTITYLPGTLTVKTTADQLTVMAGSASKTYDGTPLTNNSYTQNGLPSGYTMEVTISGSATKVADSGLGNNVITSVVIRNASNVDVTENFLNIVKVPGTLSINPAPLLATMDSMQIEFGSPVPSYTTSYSGFVNGETTSVLTSPTVASCSYTQGADVGAYPITGSGATAPNYIINYHPGTLIVGTSDDIITVVAGSASKTYDGKPLTCKDFTFSGLPAGYTLEADVTGSITNVDESATGKDEVTNIVIKNALGHDVTPSFPNIVKIPGKLTVLPKDATVVAANKTKYLGQDDPKLTAKETGVVSGEKLNYKLKRVAGEEVGTYPINVTLGSNPNYSVTTVPGILSIKEGEEKSHIIQSTSGPNGSISPFGQTTVIDGESSTFTFTPQQGYHVDTVFVDGEAVQTDGKTYTFTDVVSDHSIHVTFKADATDNGTTGGTTTGSSSPKTGDNSNILLWLVLAAASISVLLLVLRRKGQLKQR